MLAVVDTNVWVSAFLTPGGNPAQILAAFRAGRLFPAYSSDIEDEYLEVLSRPKFRLDAGLVAAFLRRIRAEGRLVQDIPPLSIALPDPDDAPFLALACHLMCPLVTGNPRHFPPVAGVDLLSPVDCLKRIAAGR